MDVPLMLPAAAALLGFPLAHAPIPQDAAGPAAALRLQVAAEAERLRQQLEAQESGADYALLLQRKFTVDCSLAPLLLQEDAAAFVAEVAAGREPPDLLRLLRAEYASAPARSRWINAGSGNSSATNAPSPQEEIARSLSAWAAGPDGMAAWCASSGVLEGTPGDAAPYIWWTGKMGGTGALPGAGLPALAARACWYEPCVEAQRLDWPLAPLALQVEWDGAGGTIRCPSGAHAAERWPAAPLFNNPNDMYAIFDCLRSRNCLDVRGSPLPETLPAPTPQLAPAAAADARTLTRVITRADGTPLRSEAWHFDGPRLSALVITQAPLRIRHRAPHSYQLMQHVDGEPVQPPEMIEPNSVLIYPGLGLSIAVSFRAPDPRRDDLEAAMLADPSSSVPERISIAVNGTLRAESVFAGIASSAGESGRARVAHRLAEWNAEAAVGASRRTALFIQAESGCARGDLAIVRSALADHAEIAGAGAGAGAGALPEAWRVANIESCVRMLGEAGHTRAAAELAADDWIPAVAALSPAERVRVAARAARSTSPSLISAALSAVSAMDPLARLAVERALDERLSGVGTPPAPSGGDRRRCCEECEHPAPDTAKAEMLAAIRAALSAGAQSVPSLDAALQAELLSCACSAVNAWETSNAPGTAQMIALTPDDLSAVIAQGGGELASLRAGDAMDRCAVCALFGRRLERALASTPPSEEERRSVRTACAMAARAAAALTRQRARARGLPDADCAAAADAAAHAVREHGRLLANPFEPAWLGARTALAGPLALAPWSLTASPELDAMLQSVDRQTLVLRPDEEPSLSARLAASIASAVAEAFKAELSRRSAWGGIKTESDGSPKRPPSDSPGNAERVTLPAPADKSPPAPKVQSPAYSSVPPVMQPLSAG